MSKKRRAIETTEQTVKFLALWPASCGASRQREASSGNSFFNICMRAQLLHTAAAARAKLHR